MSTGFGSSCIALETLPLVSADKVKLTKIVMSSVEPLRIGERIVFSPGLIQRRSSQPCSCMLCRSTAGKSVISVASGNCHTSAENLKSVVSFVRSSEASRACGKSESSGGAIPFDRLRLAAQTALTKNGKVKKKRRMTRPPKPVTLLPSPKSTRQLSELPSRSVDPPKFRAKKKSPIRIKFIHRPLPFPTASHAAATDHPKTRVANS